MRALLLAGVVTFGWVGVAQANLVVNGGFEDELAGYTVNGDNISTNVGGYTAQEGTSYLGLGTVGRLGTISQTFTDVGGQSLTLSFYLASDGTSPSQFQFAFNGLTLLDLTNPAAQPYTQYSFSAVATGNDTITFSGRDDPRYLALDNIVVVANESATPVTSVPEPASLILLGMGVVGIAAVQRRRAA